MTDNGELSSLKWGKRFNGQQERMRAEDSLFTSDAMKENWSRQYYGSDTKKILAQTQWSSPDTKQAIQRQLNCVILSRSMCHNKGEMIAIEISYSKLRIKVYSIDGGDRSLILKS